MTRVTGWQGAAIAGWLVTSALIIVGPILFALAMVDQESIVIRVMYNALCVAIGLGVANVARLAAGRLKASLEAQSPGEVVLGVALDGSTKERIGNLGMTPGLGSASEAIVRTSREGIEVWSETKPPQRVALILWSKIESLSTGHEVVVVELVSGEELYLQLPATLFGRLRGAAAQRRCASVVAAIAARRDIHAAWSG